MKLGKSIVIGLAILVPVVGIIFWLLLSNLNPIVTEVVQDVGSNVLKTEVKVTNVDVDIANGKVFISGLTIANPDGYSEPYIFSMDDIAVEIDVKSLGNSPIVINEIFVQQPKVNFELDTTGKSNLSVLKENIDQSSKPISEKEADGNKGQKEEPEVSKQARLIIKQLSFEGGQLSVHNPVKVDEKIQLELPVIRLQNLGQAKGGASGNEIAVEMMTQLVARITQEVAQITEEAAKARLKDAFSKETQKLKDEAVEAIKGLKDEAVEAIKGLFE